MKPNCAKCCESRGKSFVTAVARKIRYLQHPAQAGQRPQNQLPGGRRVRIPVVGCSVFYDWFGVRLLSPLSLPSMRMQSC